MRHSILGRTGLSIGRMGLGGLWLTADQADADSVVRRAMESGVDYVDTAPSYGDSERVIGTALAGVDRPVVISTKLGGRPSPFDPRSVGKLIESARTSLRLLGRDRIDILMIHEPDRAEQYDWWTDATYDGPVWEAIEILRQEGVVGFVGIGGTTTTELARLCESGRFDVVLTAFNFSLLWREAAIEVIPAARAAGMGVVSGSPLQGGALAVRRDAALNGGAPGLNKPRREQMLALYRLCDESGIDLASMAMRFALHASEVDVVLTGVRTAGELDFNLRALDAGPLPSDVSSALDEIAARVPFRPTLEPFSLPFDDKPVRQREFA